MHCTHHGKQQRGFIGEAGWAKLSIRSPEAENLLYAIGPLKGRSTASLRTNQNDAPVLEAYFIFMIGLDVETARPLL